MSRLNTRASHALRFLVALQWILIAALWNVKATATQATVVAESVLVFHLPAALICTCILVDWFTRKEPPRSHAKLIDALIWAAWMVSAGCMVGYSLQMGQAISGASKEASRDI